MSAAEDKYAQAEKEIAQAFRDLESDSTTVQGEFEPRVDGGRTGDPLAKTGRGAWLESFLARLPQEYQDALRANYQGSGILEELREKNVRWRYPNGVPQKSVEKGRGFNERRLSDLAEWEMGQLLARRSACFRLADASKENLPVRAVLYLILEWSGHYADYATSEIREVAGVSESTVSRARKRVYGEMEGLRKAAIQLVAERL